jgi:putative nucleotidyltransferase with HDIG domain
MRPITRIRNPVIAGCLPSQGTDDNASVYPFRGTFNYRDSARGAFRSLLALIRREPRTVSWAFSLAALCLVTAGVLVQAGYGLPPWWQFLTLALVTAATERQSVRVARNVETSVAFLPFVFTAVAFGPLSALAVGALANALDFRRPYLRWAIYVPARGLTGAAAGFVAVQAMSGEASFLRATLATVLAGVTNVVVDSVFNAGTLLVRRSAPVSVYIRSVGPLTILSLPLYVPLVALMVFSYQRYSFWTAAMFLGSAVALQRVIHLYQKQRDASEDLAEANTRLEAANLSFAAALVTTLDARDQYTAGHSESVARYAYDIAQRLGLSEQEQQLAHLCGLVHDVGKIGLPPGLLEKPAALTLAERRQMERHAAIGERILTKVEDYAEIARIVRHHHERVDGNGYPDRLVGDAIPLISRIIAVADAYDAMTSARPYRDPMPSLVARLRLARAVGSQFDANVVLAFESVLSSSDYEANVEPAAAELVEQTHLRIAEL